MFARISKMMLYLVLHNHPFCLRNNTIHPVTAFTSDLSTLQLIQQKLLAYKHFSMDFMILMLPFKDTIIYFFFGPEKFGDLELY